MTPSRPAVSLGLNGTLLMVAGLFCGAAIPAAPYPRLMLAAHSAGFTLSAVVSILAALLLGTSLCCLPSRAARIVLWGHLLLWPLCLSEVAGAFWGTTKALKIAGAQAGAPGGTPLQENIVVICHAIPAVALILAWALLVWGTWRVFRTAPSGSGTS
jgi:hypothetical protein